MCQRNKTNKERKENQKQNQTLLSGVYACMVHVCWYICTHVLSLVCTYTCGSERTFSWDQTQVIRWSLKSFTCWATLTAPGFKALTKAKLELKLLALNLPERSGRDFYVCFRICLNFFLHVAHSFIVSPTPYPAPQPLWIESRAVCLLDKHSTPELYPSLVFVVCCGAFQLLKYYFNPC